MANEKRDASGMRTRALIIGVNDYAALGDGLRGAVADAIHWYGIAKRMGIADEDITVLTSPVLEGEAAGADQLGAGVRRGAATRGAITEAVAALAASMDVAGAHKAMVTFSGHGGWCDDRGALVAPSDVAADLSDAIALDALDALLDARAEDTDVTLFVDACYRHGADVGEGGALPSLRRRDVLLSACPPRAQSHELFVGGEWRGAFSWAVTSILDRWGVREAGRDPDFNLDHGALRDRAAALLRAMAVVQPLEVSSAAFEAPRGVLSSRAAGAVDGRPSQGLVARELPVPTNWRIKLTNGTEVGVVEVTASSQTWTWYTDQVSPFPSKDFELHADTSSTPASGHTLSSTTYENGAGFSGGSGSLSGTHYAVTDGSITAYLGRGNLSQRLDWLASSSSSFSGSKITFDYQSTGSPSASYSETDDVM